MLKLIKTFISIVFIFFTLYFLHLNDAKVDVDLIYKSFFSIPVSIIILSSIGFGVILGYLFAAFSIFSSKAKIRKIENKNLILIEELNSLRNIAVDEDILSEDIGK
tara:strand:+ start:285 stop:602 length:318 start_codon:yes stop_codon:yes gene_type:complete